MTPRAGFQAPTRARASEDFPEPLGPTTPSAAPAARVKLTSCRITAPLPGAARLKLVQRRSHAGGGSATGSTGAGDCASTSERLVQLCRAAMKVFQLAIASSTGASARIDRIVAA